MGCFLGCFGDARGRRSRGHRIHRPDYRALPKRVGSFQQRSVLLADQSITEKPPPNLVSELQNRPEGDEQQLSPSPRKRVTFDSNITTYEHYSLHESTDSLPEGNANVQIEEERNPRSSSQPLLEDEKNSVKSCVVSYPPSHRYHDARDSDDEAEDCSDSDLDDLEEDYEDEDDIDCTSDGREMMWPGSNLIQSLESRTENQSASVIKSPQLLEEDATLGSKSQARNRSDYVNSVLNPVENVTQWKAVKSKGTCLIKSQKENNHSLFAPSVRCDQLKKSNQEVAVDASLSNWLVYSESTLPKKSSSSGIGTLTCPTDIVASNLI